ncbi:MAG: ABC transporter substrate-binding protein [Alphaproteobacteria bacterium]|nr:ABC transporter substrate-binding protein [Alphaproteobacteria bacterium]
MRKLSMLVAAFAASCLSSAVSAATLAVCTEASPDFLNPQFTGSQTSFDVAAQIFNRLVELDRGSSTVSPALAESWSVSPDGTAYTFKLRRGVKWHSNAVFKPSRDFNADDVVFTFDRMRDPAHPFHAVNGTNYQLFQSLGLAKNLKAVERLDDHTVRFVLERPEAALLGALSVEPFSIHSAEYGAAMLKANTPDRVDLQPIGTGPFQLVAYQKDAVVRYRAFPEHWAKAAGLADRTALVDQLVFVITPDPAVRYAKLKAGECHVMRYPNPADIKAMMADKDIDMKQTSAIDYGFLAFNSQKKPFDDKRVREAIASAINRDAILQAVFQGVTGTLANTLVPPNLWGHNPNVKPFVYDPARAKQLLAEAGLAGGFKTVLWALPVTRGYMPNGRRAAELIQADLAAVGIQAEITTFEWGEYLRRARAGEHEIGMFGYIYDYADPGQILTSGWTCAGAVGGNNRTRWCNKEFSDLIDAANRITDQAERTKLYHRIQELFREDVPALTIANSVTFTPTRKEVAGYKPHVFGGQPYFGVDVK